MKCGSGWPSRVTSSRRKPTRCTFLSASSKVVETSRKMPRLISLPSARTRIVSVTCTVPSRSSTISERKSSMASSASAGNATQANNDREQKGDRDADAGSSHVACDANEGREARPLHHAAHGPPPRFAGEEPASRDARRSEPRITALGWNPTFGTALSPGSSISKYCRFSKRNWLATRLLGKDSTIVFRFRTAPL